MLRGLDRRAGRDRLQDKSTVEISLKLSLPLVALGASAATYYPKIAQLGTELIVPDHAEVVGAVGAAAGPCGNERWFWSHSHQTDCSECTWLLARTMSKAVMKR